MTLTKKRSTISNLFWSFLTQGGVEVVRFIVAIILARLLVPADYGIMAIVGIFTGFSNVFIQFTFSPVIVQNRDLDRKDIHTIFWLNLTVGTFVAIVFVLSGSFLAQFYYQPVLKGLVALAGLQVIVASISVIQRALQEKNHNFKTIGVVRFAAALLSSIIAIILAYNNFGVWALAIHMFLLVLFECLGLFMLSKWYPKLIFSSNTFQKIKRMTSSLVLERSFGHLTESMDKFILGKFSSVSDLGLYSRSYGFLLFPLRNISQVISQVMLPKVSENKHNLKSLPSDPKIVSIYLTDLSKNSKFSTLKRRLASINMMHRYKGHYLDTKHPLIVENLMGIKRQIGVHQKAKKPLLFNDIKAIIKQISQSSENSSKKLRNKALILVGFAGGFRRSELIDIELDDVEFVDQGVKILIKRSKTDQAGEGITKAIPYFDNQEFCPVLSLKKWIESSNINSGPLFRRFAKGSFGEALPKNVAAILSSTSFWTRTSFSALESILSPVPSGSYHGERGTDPTGSGNPLFLIPSSTEVANAPPAESPVVNICSDL